jgi:hypothetical protein
LVNRADRLSVQHKAGLSLSVDLRLGLNLLFSLIITPLVLDNVAEDSPVENAQDQHDPEDVDHLQHCEKRESDGLRDPALVLLSDPVEVVGADGCELAVGKECVENFEVEEVAHVRPDADEGDEVGDCEAGVEVVEDLGSLEVALELKRFSNTRKMNVLTARKKSLMSCVMYTAIPI